jgi:hypothetical protein
MNENDRAFYVMGLVDGMYEANQDAARASIGKAKVGPIAKGITEFYQDARHSSTSIWRTTLYSQS